VTEIKKYRYGAAIGLTMLIFLLGVFASNLADDKRQSDLQDTLRDDSTDIQSKQILMRYLEGEESCELRQEGLNQIVEGYNNRLERVQSYEEKSFFQETEFRSLRRSYVLSGIEYWMFAEETDERCDSYNTNTILFFTEEQCELCDKQGETLSDIKRLYGDEVLVFSVYTDLDDSMINLLREQYDISKPPALVINQNKTLEGVHTRENITQHLEMSED
jgi:hypothetical protein